MARLTLLLTFTAVLLLVPATLCQAAAPRVVVSVLPIHSLVSGIMAGVGEPTLIVDAAQSPHGFALRPSQMKDLESADLIVRVGKGLDDFLERPIAALDPSTRAIDLMAAPGMTLRLWDTDSPGGDRDPEHDERENTDFDAHIWLDPVNARAIVTAVAAELAALDPANARVYRSNAAELDGRIAALDAEIRTRLASAADDPFIVFHDAYGYFQDAYGLSRMVAVAIDAERRPGAKRIAELRGILDARDIHCVFTEPQFPETIVATLIEGRGARAAELDPIGVTQEPGPQAYFSMMRELAAAIAACAAG